MSQSLLHQNYKTILLSAAVSVRSMQPSSTVGFHQILHPHRSHGDDPKICPVSFFLLLSMIVFLISRISFTVSVFYSRLFDFLWRNCSSEVAAFLCKQLFCSASRWDHISNRQTKTIGRPPSKKELICSVAPWCNEHHCLKRCQLQKQNTNISEYSRKAYNNTKKVTIFSAIQNISVIVSCIQKCSCVSAQSSVHK